MNERITVSDLFRYCKDKNLSFKDGLNFFNEKYTPTLNGWVRKISDND